MHERTGEIELLISGALLFGLVQAPGYLNHAFDALAPTLNSTQFMIAFFASYYIKLIVVTLIISFGLHLVTRAYWVGLVGLDSVFPEGIDWERIKYGELAKEFYRSRLPSIPQMARKADDFGSSIFSAAFLIVAIFVFSIVAGALLGSVWYVLTSTLLPRLSSTVFIAVIAVLGMIPSAATGIDKWLGPRLEADGRAAGALKRTFSVAYTVTGGALFAPIQLTLFSRVPKRVIWPLAIGVIGSLLLGFMGTEFARLGIYQLSPSDVLPVRPGPRSVASAYFASTRDSLARVPYVQSDVVEGPYLRLTIPLGMGSLLPRLEEACPDLTSGREVGVVEPPEPEEPADPEYELALIACMSLIWTVRLDSESLEPAWDLHWSRDGKMGGLLTYLRTDDLSRGAHVLEVEQSPTPNEDDEQRPRIHYIRFRR